MLSKERHKLILETLDKIGIIKNKDISKVMNVSIETVRRDLDFLSSKNLLEKIHGGAISHNYKYSNLKYDERKNIDVEEKIEIVKKAIEYIEEDMTIFLSSSTTNTYLSKELLGKFEKLTVITNSLEIANNLKEDENIKLILLGGVYNHIEKAFYGNLTIELINKFYADIAFISVSGIDLYKGLTDYNEEEIYIQKSMIDNSARKIVLNNSNKMNVVVLMNVCSINDVDIIITDSKIDNDLKNDYLEKGINLV